MSSVMMTVGLSDGVSVDDRSDGMVSNSERMDGVLPRGLVMLTIAVGIDNKDGDLGKGICAGEICETASVSVLTTGWKPTALGADDICEGNSDGTVETSSKIGSSKRDPLSRASDLMEIEDTVEIVEGVLVKLTGASWGDIKGVTTLVEDGTCNEGGEAVEGGRDGDDAEIDDPDTMAVGVGERDEEDEKVIAGDSLELSSIVLSRVWS